jgi:hypothetical protein
VLESPSDVCTLVSKLIPKFKQGNLYGLAVPAPLPREIESPGSKLIDIHLGTLDRLYFEGAQEY